MTASIPATVPSRIVPEATFASANQWVVESGREYVAIDNLEALDPFFLNIVTAGEQWFFCSSNGAPSAGRRSPESALFPYYTVDKIIDNWNSTGPWTGIVCEGQFWNPFTPPIAHLAPIRRRLLKSLLGDELVFEERHEGLGLRFSYRWQLSQKLGFVRKATITNVGDRARDFRIVDGLDNVLPPDIDSRMQLQYSCLADGYKLSELECRQALMVHRLASGIVDAPIPLESLKATTIWTHGLGEGPAYLTRNAAEKFLQGKEVDSPDRIRGKRGALLLAREMALAPGESQEWVMVAEIEQTQAEVETLRHQLADPAALLAAVEEDLQSGRDRLREVIASSDGFQQTADRDGALYHYQNTLCNLLRGGVPEKGSLFKRDQFLSYLSIHNLPLREKHAEALEALPSTLTRGELLEKMVPLGSSDLTRLAGEYLPLILSRRHGDPSRPWNKFDIRLNDEEGEPIHHFEGNWRDIFQNWEALAWSYPDFLDGFISKFVNASTIDGFNPYRITSAGVDWEAPDEDDPWVSIGYWGDHQIIYLLKLIELEAKVNPARLAESLNSPRYVFADVPYAFKSWEEILKDPKDTITFDQERDEQLIARKEKMGADGLLLQDDEGELCRATLAEKLLLPAAVKLASLVPGGGVWMNTQKPEWNDANNALAGCGLSVVTTGYLRRYIVFLESLFSDHEQDELQISSSLLGLLEGMSQAFSKESWSDQSKLTDGERFELVEHSGLILESYRDQILREGPGASSSISKSDLLEFLKKSRKALEGLLRLNKRSDGFWNAYNILDIRHGESAMGINDLPLMLEGQVAILTSGMLKPEEALHLLEALPESDLKSARHPTYLLYPDRDLPRFLEGNRVSQEQLETVPALVEMVKAGDFRVLEKNPGEGFRFESAMTNGYELAEMIETVGGFSEEDRTKLDALYESVFHHQSFTGRSGSMFSYEGLGCIYWHMISKLMLAAQEVALQAIEDGVEDEMITRFLGAYFSVQHGLGFRQTPEQFGAFPAEPYSHSSSHAGAQQPGLTGQVKEGILCRLGELGVDFKDGCLSFEPRMLRAAEFRGLPGGPEHEALPEGMISFTYAQTPIRYRRVHDLTNVSAVVYLSDGSQLTAPEGRLDRETTLEIVSQSGAVSRIDVQLPSSWLIS